MRTGKIDETLDNLDLAIGKLKNKEGKFIFVVPDTKGNAKASVSYVYKQALILQKNGYKVGILHEKNDYIKPGSWLGEEYDNLEHQSIEDNKLSVGPQDFIIAPEYFGAIFEQIQQLPVEKIIMVQSYDYLLEAFAPGKSWLDYGVYECITTSKTVADTIEELSGMTGIKFINPGFSENFQKNDKPQKPVVAIHCRDQRKAAKIIKTFYLKYPLYRFISFKDMHSMTEENFAKNLKECALSVWVDDESTFGTFPIESIKCNVPIIGKIPNIIPEWMTDDNGVWMYDENQIPDLIFNFMKNWFEDAIPENFTNLSTTMQDKYSVETFEKVTIETYDAILNKKIENLNKIKENLTMKKTNEE